MTTILTKKRHAIRSFMSALSLVKDIRYEELEELPPEERPLAVFLTSLANRMYVGRDAGWTFVFESSDVLTNVIEKVKELAKEEGDPKLEKVLEKAKVHERLGIIYVPDPIPGISKLPAIVDKAIEELGLKPGENFVRMRTILW